MTLTTANDIPGRDPIAFELSGSNESIDGPYELIASGEIVDFAGAAAWPRFTKNETAISFYNDIEYTHYQIIFTAIRGPVGGSVNSMQIAEVELLEIGPNDRVVDNFESYNDFDNLIYETWIDGFGDPTNGSFIDLAVTTFNKSMSFSYDNTGNVHYSEAYRTFVVPQDWTGFNVVSFYMRGHPNNAPAPVYVRLRDNQETESVVYSPDSNALVTGEWNELSFPLTEFQNMDVYLAEIKEVACGVGFHPKALIYDVSTGFISNPPSIGLLQADNCGYCSSYGQADIDNWALACKTWAENFWYSGCLLTGCVFHASATQGKAMVKLGTLGVTTCPGAGRYIIFPCRNKVYNVTVIDQSQSTDKTIYTDYISKTKLQTGLNVMNFGSP